MRACIASKDTLSQTWLRTANAFSYQHKHHDISLVDAHLLSTFMARPPSGRCCQPDHTESQVKLSHQATRMLLLFVDRMCKDSLPDSPSHYNHLHPGATLEQLTSTLSMSSAKGVSVQPSAHKKWMQAQHAADRSFRMLPTGCLRHHLTVLRSMLLIMKLLLLTQQAGVASSETTTVPDVLWRVSMELKSQLMMRKSHMPAFACPCCQGHKWCDHGFDTSVSVLLAQHLLCLLRKALKVKQGSAGLCCSILAGLMYTAAGKHTWHSVASVVKTSGEICCSACSQVRCGNAYAYRPLLTWFCSVGMHVKARVPNV